MGDHHQSNRQLPLFANRLEYLSVENPFDPSYFILFSHHYFVLMFCTAQLREMLRLFCCSARGQ